MFHYSLFFVLVSVITICADLRGPYVNIFIKNDTYCDIETKFIKPPSFQCEENDSNGATFNETYASFIWSDIKCYGTIENIKTQARFCINLPKLRGWRRYKSWGHRVVHTSSRHGRNQTDDKPLKAGDVFD